jgi:ATP/maltotriose-dependent transcriptional regulator MalT
MVRVRYPSKVIPPRLGGAVPRTRLFERLDAMTAAPCSWITAAPGAGKTTLVNSWSQSRRRPCLWYQFDQRDGDPATFFHYLRMAAARATASGDVCLPALTPEYLGGLPIFARNFFELLYRSLPENAVLIFDNYQDLPADSAVHALFALGLEAVVPSVKAVVVSRSDPPPEIARLRVNGLISQLSAGELNRRERKHGRSSHNGRGICCPRI